MDRTVKFRKPAKILFSNETNQPTHPDWLIVSPRNAYHRNVDMIKNYLNKQDIDWIAVQYDHKNLEQEPRTFQTLNLLTNAISKYGNENSKAVIGLERGKSYLLNVGSSVYSKTMFNVHEADEYAPSDSQVESKYDRFNAINPDAWEKHQSVIWAKMAATMPLDEGTYGRENHKAELTSPSRGLDEEDIKGMWSWNTKVSLSPGLYGDDFIGISGIKAVQFSDLEFYDGDKLITDRPLNLSTCGVDGYVIPMRNPNGDMAKFQIGADTKTYSCLLKARAQNGVSIQKSEYLDKNSEKYNFNINGRPSKLRVKNANNKEAVLEDVLGEFVVPMKKDIKQTLIERGYEIPELIDSLRPVGSAKYMWPAKGNMVGSTDMSNKVAPSNAGFIISRQPKVGDKYTVLVVEGALKGKITAKYLNHPNCQEFADRIAGDDGLIIAQVPGVAKAFVESVGRIYSKYPIDKTVIAMDADGRTNLSVAEGIHQSYTHLAPYTKGRIGVMSWDPKQKGIDDALLAMSRGEITVDHMDLKFGTAQQLFPLEEAKRPVPLRLDGTPAYNDDKRPEWQIEYTEQRKARDREMQIKQIATELRNGQRDAEEFIRELTATVDIEVVAKAGKLSKDTLSDEDFAGLDEHQERGR